MGACGAWCSCAGGARVLTPYPFHPSCVQMLGDQQQGWAWTRAVLGVPVQEVHVC